METTTVAASDARRALSNRAAEQTDAAGSGGNISSDFETFLKMLTVQMENQDPLNPVDSADYAVQLATFSNVEQQVLTNDLLRGLTDQFGMSGLNQIANWVGQRARVTEPVLSDGQPMTVVAETAPTADSAELVVKAEDGTVLERHAISAPGGEFEWTPMPSSGAGLVPVTFEVESFAGGQAQGAAPAPVYAPVREVRMDDGLAMIVLSGGGAVPASQVTALREG